MYVLKSRDGDIAFTNTECAPMILDQFDNASPAYLSEAAEEAIYKMAEAMGLMVSEEEAQALASFNESTNLTEMQNIVKLNRAAKLSSLTIRSALVIAQQKKDPMFVKYARAAQLKRQLRNKIAQKYGAQAQSTARKLLANAGKRNMVDISQRPSSLSNPETR